MSSAETTVSSYLLSLHVHHYKMISKRPKAHTVSTFYLEFTWHDGIM